MDNAELKKALLNQRPVVYVNLFGDRIFYACVSGILYRRSKDGNIVISAELQDKTTWSVITVDPERVAFEGGTANE